MLKRYFIIFVFVGGFYGNSVAAENNSAQTQTPIYEYKVIKIYPHDTSAFTEGLVYHDGNLYESTGLNGQSKLRKIDLPTGKILRQINLSPAYFAEGIAILGDRIFQLTYQSHLGFIYNLATFKLEKNFHYDSEGWGLTTDGQQLIMSDGTDRITFRDPDTFQIVRQINVHDEKGYVNYVNELEYIDHKIYANIWQTDLIAIISPVDGKILAWINLKGLDHQPDALRLQNVLNGIAYDAKRKILLVTGKNWSHIYAIQLQKF